MRVIRVLVYEGPEQGVSTALGRSLADGSREFGRDGVIIRVITLPQEASVLAAVVAHEIAIGDVTARLKRKDPLPSAERYFEEDPK